MNTEKRVFAKLFKAEEKTELATHKIELGVTDIADLRRDARNTHDEVMKETTKSLDKVKRVFSDLVQNLFKAEKELSSYKSDLDSKIKRNEKLGKEIGVDIKSTPVGKKMALGKKEIEGMLKSLNRRKNEVQSLKF
mgnify:CR=1 FL=1|tara:strand:+ start:512 stop:919 length:408 start_codon:yes stop_codon:yes gene_type:complete